MSLSSGFKAAGPPLGSVAFAWSLTSPSLDVHFTFAICALLAALTFRHSFRFHVLIAAIGGVVHLLQAATSGL